MHLSIKVLIHRVGLNNVNYITSTYMKATKTVDKTVLYNKYFLRKVNLDVTEINKKLRNISLTHRLHKKPNKAWFISAALNVLKPILLWR